MHMHKGSVSPQGHPRKEKQENLWCWTDAERHEVRRRQPGLPRLVGCRIQNDTPAITMRKHSRTCEYLDAKRIWSFGFRPAGYAPTSSRNQDCRISFIHCEEFQRCKHALHRPVCAYIFPNTRMCTKTRIHTVDAD